MYFQFVFMLIKVRQVEHFMLSAFRCLDMKEPKFQAQVERGFLSQQQKDKPTEVVSEKSESSSIIKKKHKKLPKFPQGRGTKMWIISLYMRNCTDFLCE